VVVGPSPIAIKMAATRSSEARSRTRTSTTFRPAPTLQLARRACRNHVAVVDDGDL